MTSIEFKIEEKKHVPARRFQVLIVDGSANAKDGCRGTSRLKRTELNSIFGIREVFRQNDHDLLEEVKVDLVSYFARKGEEGKG